MSEFNAMDEGEKSIGNNPMINILNKNPLRCKE